MRGDFRRQVKDTFPLLREHRAHQLPLLRQHLRHFRFQPFGQRPVCEVLGVPRKIGVLPSPKLPTIRRAMEVARSTSLPTVLPEPTDRSPNTAASAAIPA